MYRTKDGTGIYQFGYIENPDDGTFEIDIQRQPSYNGRYDGGHVTHRLSSDRGGNKICVTVGKEPRDIEAAVQRLRMC